MTQTTSEFNPVQSTFYDVSCLLHVTREFSLKQFSKHKFKNKSSRTWSRKLAINTLTSLEPLFLISLSSFLETKFFGAMRHLSVICWMCYCFPDAIQTRLGSNKLTQIYSFPPPSKENLKEAPTKKPPISETLFECKRCTILIG